MKKGIYLYILFFFFFSTMLGSVYFIKKYEDEYINNMAESALYFQNPSRVLLKATCLFDEAMYEVHRYQHHKLSSLTQPELLFLSTKNLLNSHKKNYKKLLDYIDNLIYKINNHQHINVSNSIKEFHRLLTEVSFIEYKKSIELFEKYKKDISFFQIIVYTTITIIILFSMALIFILYQTNLLHQIKFLSETDQLTKAYNRRKFFKEIKKCNNIYSLVMFDIDHFKEINDTYGHDKGDFVLKKLVDIIRTHIRKEDMIFRWGGEEFFILFKNMPLEEAHKTAEKLRKIVENTDFGGIKVTISLSVITAKDEKMIEKVIKNLDNGLYEAKNSGRNKVVVKGEV